MSAQGSRKCWLAAALGVVMIVGVIAYPRPVAGFPNGYWQDSENPLFPCDEGDDFVCSEWITGNEESLYQPCCIHESAESWDLSACDDPLVGKRPSDF